MGSFIKEVILTPILQYWRKIAGVVLYLIGGYFFFSIARVPNITGYFVLILLPLGLALGYFIYRAIYENVSENMFGDTFGALTTIILGLFSVVYIQSKWWSEVGNEAGNAVKTLDESTIILYLILTSLLWVAGTHLIFQTYPLGSGKDIKVLIRELRYSERQKLDWLQEGKNNYSVEVFKLNRVPYDITTINKDAESPQKIDSVLKSFFRNSRKSDKQRVLILIGSFGTGKSTALVNGVIKQLKSLEHGHAVPIYVKLRDCINPQNIIDRQMPSDIEFRTKICDQFTSAGNTDHIESIQKTLFKFHQNRKIVYIFDGLNEILQMTDSKALSETEAQRLANYLYAFTAGNDCILSFYPMPGIITSQSLSIDNLNRKYQIFGIHGVAEARKEREKISENILNSVALFRMYGMLDEEDTNHKTTYGLIESTLETRFDSMIASSMGEMRKLEQLVDNHLFNTDNLVDFSSPYHAIKGLTEVDYSGLCDIRVLQKYDSSNEESEEYGFCHILILEFFVARVIINKLRENTLQESAAESISRILKGSSPDYWEHMHIAETNRMIIEELNCNGDIVSLKRLLDCLLPEMKGSISYTEDELKYIAFLLQIGVRLTTDDSESEENKNAVTITIPSESVNRLKNEKLKISLLELCDSSEDIKEEMKGWNSSFVALKREFFKKIDVLNSPSTKDTTDSSMELDAYIYRQYLMEEYIAETKKIDSKTVPKSKKHNSPNEILRIRQREHAATTWLYITAVLLNLIQIGMIFSCFLGSDRTGWPVSYLPFSIAKALAILFCILSGTAFHQQKFYNIEVYGQALSDISSNMPMVEFLGAIKERKNGKRIDWTIVVEWLRNRPSTVIMLIWLLTCLWSPSIIFEFIAHTPNVNTTAGWIIMIAIELLAFFSIIPKWSSYTYWESKHKEDDEYVIYWEALATILGIFFVFPGIISMITKPWICFGVIGILGIVIYFALAVFSWNQIKNNYKTDKRTLTKLHKTVQTCCADKAIQINSDFNKMSSSGQIRFLEWLQTGAEKEKLNDIKDGPFYLVIQSIDDKDWKPKSDRVMLQIMNMISGPR